MDRQVRGDGSHFEQSAYYHVYALDFFLLYRVLANPGAAYDAKLVRMAEYLDALLGNSGVLPLIKAIRADGITSLHAIAAELNRRGILAARGGRWYATTVRNTLARVG